MHAELAPDASSLVVVGTKTYGVWGKLYCLDLNAGLKEVWRWEDDALSPYAALIASPTRLLVATPEAELLLFDLTAPGPKLLGRKKVLDDESGLLSHPAIVGTRLYLRGSNTITCIDLGP